MYYVLTSLPHSPTPAVPRRASRESADCETRLNVRPSTCCACAAGGTQFYIRTSAS